MYIVFTYYSKFCFKCSLILITDYSETFFIPLIKFKKHYKGAKLDTTASFGIDFDLIVPVIIIIICHLCS